LGKNWEGHKKRSMLKGMWMEGGGEGGDEEKGKVLSEKHGKGGEERGIPVEDEEE
jgi:hypothetical protein